MSKPWKHARSSVKKFGGKPEDYIEIHEFIDSSNTAFPDLRHRCLTHNNWFIYVVLPRVFDANFENSDGKTVDVRDIGQQHVKEDYGGFIPSAQDFIEHIPWSEWMSIGGNGAVKPSSAKIGSKKSVLMEAD